ncbi:MAG: hypothetical protein J6T10_01375 [Methanobrevibacter sp.]|nr:hypothetical protein [Methanobrevibacter sp.]
MDDIKEKLMNAVNDGLLDSNEVVEKLLEYIDEDDIARIIDNEGWDIGQSTYDEDYEE